MYDDPFIPDSLVIDSHKDTGLYHPDGGRIHRAGTPIGFGREPERRYIIKEDN